MQSKAAIKRQEKYSIKDFFIPAIRNAANEVP
jgi:hypothetical protein